jgi:hypothetical protein
MYYLEAQIFLSNTYLDRITLDLGVNEYGSTAHKTVFGVQL